MKRIRGDGSGQAEQLTATEKVAQVPVSLSDDGKYLAYHEYEQKQPPDIWILPLSPRAEPFRVLRFGGQRDAADVLAGRTVDCLRVG